MSSTGSNIQSAVPASNDLIDLSSIGKDKKNLILAMESLTGKTINTETEYNSYLKSLFGNNKNVMTSALNVMGNTSLSKEQRNAALSAIETTYSFSNEKKGDLAKLKSAELKETLNKTTDEKERKKIEEQIKQEESNAIIYGKDKTFDSAALVEATKAKNLNITKDTSARNTENQLTSTIQETSKEFFDARGRVDAEQKRLNEIKANTIKETESLLNKDFDKAETLSYKDANGYRKELVFKSAAEMSTLADQSGMSNDDIIKNMKLVDRHRSGGKLTDDEQKQLNNFGQTLTNTFKNMSSEDKSKYAKMSAAERKEYTEKTGKRIAEAKADEAVRQEQKQIQDRKNEESKFIQNGFIRAFEGEDVRLNKQSVDDMDKKFGLSKITQEQLDKLQTQSEKGDKEAIKKLDQIDAWTQAKNYVKKQESENSVKAEQAKPNSVIAQSKQDTDTVSKSSNATKEDTITTKKEVYNSSTGRVEETQKNNPQTTTAKSDNTKSQTSGGGEDKQIVINLIVNGETIQQLAKSVKNLESNAAG